MTSFQDLIEPHQHDLGKCLEIAFDHLGEYFETLPWKGQLIDFDPNTEMNQRLFFQIFGISFCLMRIYPVTIHAHPWEIHVKRLLGSYKMGRGTSNNVMPPSDLEISTINAGDTYHLMQNEWHFCKELSDDNLSLVVMGNFYEKKHPFFALIDEKLRWAEKIPMLKDKHDYLMDEDTKKQIKKDFRKACQIYGKPINF